MVDYYKTLGVKRTASAAEIKSAYRRLARAYHPDMNQNSARAAQDFALLALAYRTLSDPAERAKYDAKQARLRTSSVIHSNNIHARRMRMVTVQARIDKAVDRWLEVERRENFALQQAVFTTVTLFLSTFIVAMLKPKFWQNFDGFFGRAVLLTLFVIGVWHLTLRLRDCFVRYTYRPSYVQDSIMRDEEKPEQPFTRFTASAFLVIGYAVSIGLGLFVGAQMHYVVSDMAFFFDQHVRPDLLFYPPIAVLIVDTMHTVASKIDS